VASTLGTKKAFFPYWSGFEFFYTFLCAALACIWVAVGCLWILDASINISMEPFRALVADKLPDQQRSYGFVIQTLIIGIGTWIASNLPWIVSELGVSDAAATWCYSHECESCFFNWCFVFLMLVSYIQFLLQRNIRLRI